MAVALLQAVEDCRYTQARLLIEQGVNINSKNSSGCTPLIMALTIPDENRRFKMFRWLLRMGADSGYIDGNHGRDLLSWAAYYDRAEQVRCILDVDEGLVNVHHQDRYGRTAMHYATMHENVEALYLIVQHAVKYGLTVDIRDKDGLTPYLMASMMQHRDCRRILVDIGRAVTSQMVLTLQLQKPEPEPSLSRSMTQPNLRSKTFLPPLNSVQHLPESHSTTSSVSSASSSSPVNTSKRKNIPRLMDILSQQTSLTYRPAARLPVVKVPSAKPKTPKANDKPVISLTAAVRITAMAASFRKRKQNKQ